MLSIQDHVKHRETLLDSMVDNSIAIIPSAHLQQRNADAHFSFRQDSDFFYLTGFTEDNSCLVLVKKGGQKQAHLFCQPKIKEQEIWDGIRLGPDAAITELNVDCAYSIKEFDEKLPDLMSDCEAVYAAWGSKAVWDENLIKAVEKVKLKVRTGVTAPTAMLAIAPILHEQRLIKSPAELDIMHKAGQLSAKAHCEAMKRVKPGMNEYQLEAELQYQCARLGGRHMAYTSIVGSGNNACILHYTDNDQVIEEGDLILIDAGCELSHYASDITRTFPSTGKFNEEQKALYQLVLDAQLAAIDAVKPGNTFNDPHEMVLQILTKGLVELGLLEGDVEELIKKEAYKPFFMHKTGHWLGLDVHDVGQYKQKGEWRTLEPGMVLTIEPGLYISPNDETVDEKWRGIGIRIEDDVAVTTKGCQVLSSDVPKSIEEIEALMAS